MIILIHFSKALYRKLPDRREPDKVVPGLPRNGHIIHPAKELP
jgi:hypothetical protein